MNVLCLGGQVVGPALAWDLVKTFLGARFDGGDRFRRRLGKVAELEGPLGLLGGRLVEKDESPAEAIRL
jgi:ribose 5-phosphate isomerase B